MSKFTVKITTPLIQEGKAQTAQTINKTKYLEIELNKNFY